MKNFRLTVENVLTNRPLLILILLGLLLRLYLATLPGFKIDMDAWASWAVRINQVGFANFYSSQIWTNYTPGYLYILGVLGTIKEILSLDGNAFYYLLKLPTILAEVFLAAIIYFEVKKTVTEKWAIISAGAVLFNPSFIFDGAIWGQVEGVLSILMILAILKLKQGKIILAAILLGLSILIKPQALALLPVFGLFLLSNFSLKKLVQIVIPSSLIFIVLALPFFPTHPLTGLVQLITQMTKDYPYTSLFAYNFWGNVGFWIKDDLMFGPLTYQNWGFVLFIVYWLTILYCYLKKRIGLYSLAALACLSFYFLPTRVHDRYLYPALVFLILAATEIKNRSVFYLQILLSLSFFLNLYFVYIYYNQFFYNLPQVIYLPALFSFLDANGKILSSISTALFIIISVLVIIRQNEKISNRS